MKELLIKLWIVQKFKNNGLPREQWKGSCNWYAYRLNPFNPLSYILIPIGLLITIFMFGVVGFTKEVDWSNPFKWH
jgi:hypothetical protein